jgi:hypothetical protein
MSATIQNSAAAEARLSLDHDEKKAAASGPMVLDDNVDKEAAHLPPSPKEEAVLQKWNSPRINAWRFLVTLYSFIILGMNDGTVGVRSSPVILSS